MNALDHSAAARPSGPDEIKNVPEDWSVPDDVYGWTSVARVFVPLFGLTALAPYAVTHLSAWMLIPIALLLGGRIHMLLIVAHDCCHYSLFRNRKLNRAVGELSCLLLGSSFRTYTRIHWAHHTALGEETDPQAVDYMGLGNKRTGQVVWHLFEPLFGVSLFKLLQYNGVVTRRGGASGSGGVTRGLAARAASVVALQLLLAALASDFGRIWWLIPFFPATAATFGLMFSRWRSVAEHVAPRDGKLTEATRSHAPNLFDSLFMHTMNFNYHVEHHRMPSLPSCRLPALHERVKDSYADDEFFSPGTLNTITGYIRSESGKPNPAVVQ